MESQIYTGSAHPQLIVPGLFIAPLGTGGRPGLHAADDGPARSRHGQDEHERPAWQKFIAKLNSHHGAVTTGQQAWINWPATNVPRQHFRIDVSWP